MMHDVRCLVAIAMQGFCWRYEYIDLDASLLQKIQAFILKLRQLLLPWLIRLPILSQKTRQLLPLLFLKIQTVT